MMNEKIKPTVLSSIFLLLFLLTVLPGGIQSLQAKTIEGIKIGEFNKDVLLTGSLKALKAEEFEVPISNSWQIQIKWMEKEGELVKPGAPVVRFDASSLVTENESLEMTLQEKKEAKLQKLSDYDHHKFELEVSLKKSEIDYKKKEIDASIPRGLETNYDYDKKQLELKQSKQTLENAKLEKKVKLATLQSELRLLDIEIEEAQSKLEKNQKMIQRMNLSANTEGTLVYGTHLWEKRKIQIGDNVQATWTVATIPDTDSLEVEAWVNETQIQHILPNQQVDLILDASPEQTYTGKIKNIMKSAETIGNWGKAHYFLVSITLDKKDSNIMKPGMSVKCMVHVAHFTDVVLVPLEKTNFNGHVYTVDNGTQTPVEVEPLGINLFYLALKKEDAQKLGIL